MEQSGDAALPSKREGLKQFFAFARALKAVVPASFLGRKERRTLPQDRDPFEGWDES